MKHIEQEPTSRELTLCGRDIDIDLPGDVISLGEAAEARDYYPSRLADYCVECAAKLDRAIRDYDPTPASHNE